METTLELLIQQIEISSNGIASSIFRDIYITWIGTLFVIILTLYFGSLALSFLKNI